MKINLFSPLPPTRSEIARLTTNLLPLLAEHAELVVWTSESKWDPTAEAHATVRHYDPARPPWRAISEADVTFYQMGNDPRYHHGILRVSQQHPGIIILHDLMLQHLFAGLVFHDLGLSRRQYLELAERHHGVQGRVLAEAHLQGLLGTEELGQHCPLTGAATENALAVIVHSEAAFRVVSQDLPAAYLPLCICAPGPAEKSIARSPGTPRQPYRISLFGFLGPNRRLPVLLRALANFAERDRFRLDIYGTIEGEEKIQQLIGRLGLGELVTMHGFVHQDELDEALRRTDLGVNLRNPSMGEASASQLHLWQYALPALVSRAAWYETLPEDTVAFVRPDREAEDIQAHLAAFLENPEKYRELGRNGQRHVTENHAMETYARSLLEVANLTPEFRTRWIARDLSRRAASGMNAWCDASTMDAFLPRVAEQVTKLATGTPRYAAARGAAVAPSTALLESA